MSRLTLSLVVPFYNEEGNVEPLYYEAKKVFESLKVKKTISEYEIILVNDGSRDSTQNKLESLKRKEKEHLKIIELRRNFGQTAALKAGFDLSSGDLVVTMDGDMQNDPSDIPRMIQELEKGYDVISGWRFQRKDKLGKRFSSLLMNFLRKKMISDNLHDYGCALKIYKRECIKDLQLYGELHRFITAYLLIKGYKIGEIKVNHRERKSGKTKYGFSRGINGILDLVFLKFWAGYSSRPLHFFGRIGLYQELLAVLICIEQIIKALIVKALTFGPLLALASLLVVTGLLTIMFGFLSEIMSRTYFTNEKIYSIKRII